MFRTWTLGLCERVSSDHHQTGDIDIFRFNMVGDRDRDSWKIAEAVNRTTCASS